MLKKTNVKKMLKVLIIVYCGNSWVHKYNFFLNFKPGEAGSKYYALKS